MLTKDEAMEASQDTFLKVYGKIDQFEKNAKLSTWIYKIAYRTGLDYLKKRRNYVNIEDMSHRELGSDSAEVSKHIEDNDLRKSVQKLIKKLKKDEGLILRLFYLEELSIKEINQITEQSVSNIKIKLFRARKKLKELIENNNEYHLQEYIR